MLAPISSRPSQQDLTTVENPLDQSDYYPALVKGMIHKLNNILAVIQGNASLMHMETGLSEDALETLEQIREACANATRLEERIIQAAGCATCELSSIALTDAAPGIVTAAARIASDRGVPLQTQVSERLPAVGADLSRLHDLVLELVKNAVEACPADGVVTLRFHAPGEGPAENATVVSVSNTVHARVSEDTLAVMFQPFEGKKGGVHYGIGLTIAAILASQMKMELGVRCAEDATAFELSIPASAG